MRNEIKSELITEHLNLQLAKGQRCIKKKIYAVVNLSCKKIDGRFKRVYTRYTLKS